MQASNAFAGERQALSGDAAQGPLGVVGGIGIALALSGCGGNGLDGAREMLQAVQPPARPELMPGGRETARQIHPTPTPAEFMDWAERQFPTIFGPGESDRETQGMVFRFYPLTGHYLGVMGNDVLALGPLTQGVVVTVGTLQSFADAVGASTSAPLTDAAASRFLQQATFGTTDADLAAVKAQGFAAWLAEQMAMPRGERSWDWMVANGYAAIDERALYDSGGPTAEAVLAKEAVFSTDPVRQRVALALSEYFVVSMLVSVNWTGMAMAHYWDQLQDHAFGNFRELLEAVTLNPAMGSWLNTRGNLKEDPATGRVPDENYAREVMQLFTIGLVQLNADGTPKRGANNQPLSSYTQDDVTQLARIFTGWDYWDDGRRFIAPQTNNARTYPEYTRRPMVFDATKHSTLTSVVLGRTIASGSDGPARMRAALDILFQHPNVGPFFGRQMIQRLVTSNPSPAYVARVASAFDNNGAGVRGDLKAVWRAILLDNEARGAESLALSTHGKVREPMVRVLQWLRTFGVRSRSGQWGYWPIGHSNVRSGYGQRAFAAPSVFNWFRPGYIPPGTTMSAAGATAPEFQILNESSISQWVNAIDDLNLTSTDPVQFPWMDWHARFDAERAIAHDPRALLQRLNLLLAAEQISPINEQRIVEILELGNWMPSNPTQITNDHRRWRVISAITLVMTCVEYLVQK